MNTTKEPTKEEQAKTEELLVDELSRWFVQAMVQYGPRIAIAVGAYSMSRFTVSAGMTKAEVLNITELSYDAHVKQLNTDDRLRVQLERIRALASAARG